MYLWIYSTHANMALVDLNIFIGLAEARFLVFEIIFSQFIAWELCALAVLYSCVVLYLVLPQWQ